MKIYISFFLILAIVVGFLAGRWSAKSTNQLLNKSGQPNAIAILGDGVSNKIEDANNAEIEEGSIVKTNSWDKAPQWALTNTSIRLVNGQYVDSTGWKDISDMMLFRKHPSRAFAWYPMAESINAELMMPDKIICEVQEAGTDEEGHASEEMVAEIAIYNYPNANLVTTGQRITDSMHKQCRAIRVDNYVKNGISLEAYDCGTRPNR